MIVINNHLASMFDFKQLFFIILLGVLNGNPPVS